MEKEKQVSECPASPSVQISAKDTHFSFVAFRVLNWKLHDWGEGGAQETSRTNSQRELKGHGPDDYIVDSIRKPTHELLEKKPTDPSNRPVGTPSSPTCLIHIHLHSEANILCMLPRAVAKASFVT